MTRAGRRGMAPASGAARPEPDESARIGAFLERHPDFLLDHPEVLAALHRRLGDGIVDFQGALIDRLQRNNAALDEARCALLERSRTLLSCQAQVHEAVLAMMDCQSFPQLIETITTDLAMLLDLDVTVLAIESAMAIDARQITDIVILGPGTVDSLIGNGARLLLREEAEASARLYGGAAGLVRSEALIRLQPGKDAPTGLLALGSRRPGRFSDDQGSALYGFLGSAVEKAIRSWLIPDEA